MAQGVDRGAGGEGSGSAFYVVVWGCGMCSAEWFVMALWRDCGADVWWCVGGRVWYGMLQKTAWALRVAHVASMCGVVRERT